MRSPCRSALDGRRSLVDCGVNIGVVRQLYPGCGIGVQYNDRRLSSVIVPPASENISQAVACERVLYPPRSCARDGDSFSNNQVRTDHHQGVSVSWDGDRGLPIRLGTFGQSGGDMEHIFRAPIISLTIYSTPVRFAPDLQPLG
jgi:hypothetical protein